MSGKRTRSFKCAVHQTDGEISSLTDFHVSTQQPPFFARMVRFIADEFLLEERDRKYYADHYKCWPPPLFLPIITLIQLLVFGYYTVVTGEMEITGPVPMDSPFIYRPDARQHVWRFMLYSLLHASWVHLAFNLLVQLLLGLPLEMIHGSSRIGAIYMAGVLAGSLGTSVFNSKVFLVGASGGVYALMSAHLANILLNYANMQFAVVRLVGIIFVASFDVAFAIYNQYAYVSSGLRVSYLAHVLGAMAGLIFGLVVLKNFSQSLHTQLYWWMAAGFYMACTAFAIIYNLAHQTYPYDGVLQLMDFS
uniref:rhomboid protease n=1 Tax=Hirondellea gigas TaxID=1518452 RepID=A0A6A7FS57_9CRUS